ncbi:hypothetical protein P7H21_04145 [Paenibacillus larvae]|nr:hypothetical protein [Paenibacillus larvae]MDT2303385.1 hypothetical protein [Paenibacillus larvae]
MPWITYREEVPGFPYRFAHRYPGYSAACVVDVRGELAVPKPLKDRRSGKFRKAFG